MNTILFASMLALFTDPATGAPSCEELLADAEEQVLVCEEHLDVAHEAIEALVYSIDQLTSSTTTGGAPQCTSQICDVVAACRRAGTDNLGKCVEEGCGGPLGCL